MTLKPTIKLPGGKSRLLPEITKYLPKDLKTNEYKYLEPFIGGASVLLHLVENKYVKPENCYINDYNPDIVNLYLCIKSNPTLLCSLCDEFSSNMSEDKFKELKQKFNSPPLIDYRTLNSKYLPFERATLFLVLNKNCFNGLIRYNQIGEFNSPYGKYDNPTIYNPQNILDISNILNQTHTILSLDFELFIRTILGSVEDLSKVFVYLDPPYLPISLTSSFAGYTSSGFRIYDHIRLRNIVDVLNKYKIKFMLSNSNCLLTKEIFRGYNIKTLRNRRSISAKSKSRGLIKEVLITNYD